MAAAHVALQVPKVQTVSDWAAAFDFAVRLHPVSAPPKIETVETGAAALAVADEPGVA